MNRLRSFVTTLLSATFFFSHGVGSRAHAAIISFQGLGFLPGATQSSVAFDISADGSTVVGYSSEQSGTAHAFRWSAATGMVPVLAGGSNNFAVGVSHDGSVIAGNLYDAVAREAFRWSAATGTVGIGELPGGPSFSDAKEISRDGTTIVGESDSASGREAFKWTFATGIVGLGVLGAVEEVNSDGSVIVGSYNRGNGTVAYRWTSQTGRVDLIAPPSSPSSRALGVSADGNTIVGTYFIDNHYEPMRWTADSGMVSLGGLPGFEAFGSMANAISEEGTIVGYSFSSKKGYFEAVVWDSTHGIQSLTDMLIDYGIRDWELDQADAISADGRTIVGNGYNRSSGRREAWVLTIPEPTAATLLICGVAFCVRRQSLGRHKGLSAA